METTTTTQKPVIFIFGKYRAEVKQRDGLRYPQHKWGFTEIEERPKAKHIKEFRKTWVYMTQEEAIKAAQNWIKTKEIQTNRREEEKQRKRAENAAVIASDFYKIGDIVYNSWGYEQTNIDFFKVVKVGPRTIEVREIDQKTEPGSEYSHGMACKVIPGENFLKEGKTYLLRVKKGGILSSPESYYYISKWDGQPVYCSWYA